MLSLTKRNRGFLEYTAETWELFGQSNRSIRYCRHHNLDKKAGSMWVQWNTRAWTRLTMLSPVCLPSRDNICPDIHFSSTRPKHKSVITNELTSLLHSRIINQKTNTSFPILPFCRLQCIPQVLSLCFRSCFMTFVTPDHSWQQ